MCKILRFTKRDLVWLLLLIFFVGALSFLTVHIAHGRGSDIMVRDGKIYRSLDGRGGIPLWWDGFIYGQYAGTARDCILYNYTGSGNYILNLKADGSTVFSVDKTGNVVASGLIGGSIDKIIEGNSFVEVVDPGTGYITFELDGSEVGRFASNQLTLSGLTASRLVVTNAFSALESSDLFLWIAGTSNQITVTDDTDGTVTLSLPQDIHSGASPQFIRAGLGIAAGTARLQTYGAGNDEPLSGLDSAVYIVDSRDYNATYPGGMLVFGGEYNSSANITPFAGIRATKNNTGDGSYDADMRFYTRKNGDDTWQNDERMTITSTGRIAIGPGNILADSLVEIAEDASSTELIIGAFHDTEATTPQLSFRKADNNQASPQPVDSGAVLGTVNFEGRDNNSFEPGAVIYAKADANWGVSERGTDLHFQTRDGNGALIDRMTVGAGGYVGIGTTSPTYKLQTKAATTIESATQTGVGLDDMTSGGTFTGVTARNYDVYIDQAAAAKTADAIIQPTGALNNGSYTAVTTTKSTGSGDDNLTVDVTVAGGVVTVITVNVGGNTYTINDTITLSGLSGGGGGGNDDGTFDIASVVDTFKWKDNASWDVEKVEITGSPQTLNYGVTIIFGAVIGHTATDYWEFSTIVIQPFLVEDESGNDLVSVLNNGYVGIGITTPTNILTIHETIDNTGAWSADGNSLLGLTNGRNNDDSATILRFTNYRTGGSYPGGGYGRGGVVYEYTNVGAKERRLTLTENLGTNNTLVLYNGNTGIGTITPNTLFEMAEESADTVATISTYHDTEATTPTLTLRKADGTEANPTAVDSGAYLGTVNFNGYDDNGWDTGAMIYAEAIGNWGAAERGTDLRFKTREGAGDLISHFTIEADGDIIAPQIYSEDLNGMTFRDVQVKDDGTLGYNSSTIRKKTNVEVIKDISWFYKLKPITFEYKKRTEDGEYLEEGDGTRRYGLIAEDVEKTEPIFVFYNPDGSVEGVHYTDLVTPLIKTVQDQNIRLKKLEKVNDLQEIEINLLKKQMAEIRKRLKL